MKGASATCGKLLSSNAPLPNIEHVNMQAKLYQPPSTTSFGTGSKATPWNSVDEDVRDRSPEVVPESATNKVGRPGISIGILTVWGAYHCIFPMETKSTSVGPLLSHRPEGPSNRSFGYTVGGILLCLAIGTWLLKGQLTIVTGGMAAVGLALVVLAFGNPRLLTTPNRLWTKLGLLLFTVVNPIVMFLIYATVFVPIGFYLKLRGRDPLAASLDRTAKTYWKTRPPREPDPSTMFNQF